VVREIHLNHGVFFTKSATEETRDLPPAQCGSKKAKTLIIEHPLRAGYTLLNQKPMEKTADNLPFLKCPLAAGATRHSPVSEEHVFD